MGEREDLFRLWKLKSQMLAGACSCHEFYRDVDKVFSLAAAQEIPLGKAFNDLQLQIDSGVPLIVNGKEIVSSCLFCLFAQGIYFNLKNSFLIIYI